MGATWLVVCVTHHLGLNIIFGLWQFSWIFAVRNTDFACMQTLLYWWTFCMYWDLLKVDLFLHQMRSNNRLVSIATIVVPLT